MTEEELRQISKRCEKATPGPWKLWGTQVRAGSDPDVEKSELVATVPLKYDSNHKTHIYDAYFIAPCREDIPILLNEVEKLREALRFYADPTTYHAQNVPCEHEVYNGEKCPVTHWKQAKIDEDLGKTARAALEGA